MTSFKPQIAILGYVSKDIIRRIHTGEVIKKIGGKVYYTGAALAALDTPTLLFSKTAQQDKQLNKHLQHKKNFLVDFTTKTTPMYENIYPTKNLNERYWKATHDTFQFTLEKIKPYEDMIKKSKFIHLAPESRNTIPFTTMKYLHHLHIPLSLDVDFYIRKMKKEGLYKYTPLSAIQKILKYVTILAMSDEDAKHTVPGKNPLERAKTIAALGPREIILTQGSQGALVYDARKKKKHVIKAKSIKKKGDVTGAGDTFIAAYLHARLTSNNLQKCGDFAARVTEKKIQHHGALQLNEQERKKLQKMIT